MTSTSINITNSTIFSGVTADVVYMPIDISNKTVAIPLYTFIGSTPSQDFIQLTRQDINLEDVAFIPSPTPLNVAFTLVVGTSAVCVPLYSNGGTSLNAVLNVNECQLADNFIATGNYVAVVVNHQTYGMPIYEYSSLYNKGPVTPSPRDVNTIISEPTQDTNTKTYPSTYANNKINRYSQLIDRLKRNLGFPFVEVELCNEQFSEFIDQALEMYTKFAGYTEEYLAFDSNKYPTGQGIHIPTVLANIELTYQGKDKQLYRQFVNTDNGEFRKALDVFSFDKADMMGTDVLFSLEFIYAQQAYYSYALGSYGFDLLTWETLKQFLEQRKRSFAMEPKYRFDVRTQRLRLLPEPSLGGGSLGSRQRFIGVVGLYLERQAQDLIKERWVQQYSLALSKIAIGNIRTKFGNVTLFGGGQINGTDILSQGLKEKEELERSLLKTWDESPSPAPWFIG